MAQLAETVGITMENTINSRKNAAIIGCLHKEKEHKSMKKAAIIGQRLADNLKGRKDQLRKGREFKILNEACKILHIKKKMHGLADFSHLSRSSLDLRRLSGMQVIAVEHFAVKHFKWPF